MAPIEQIEMVDKMTDGELQQRALGVIGRELSAYGLTRFLRTYRGGSGDYTRDRHEWQDGLAVQDVIAQM